ncbi:MAG TPA: endonuclease/exonuclease/phosphatase family protein [Thermoanaerobaculia bacterium]|nr:endonuclease/exonuclease/phosphatase family protein [Thermoanaerobaculia bacterium]
MIRPPGRRRRAAPVAGVCAALAIALLGCSDRELTIAQVQGSGAVSPLVGQTVSVTGVVTAVLDEGAFFLQSTRPDRSPLTSEGLLVRGGGVAQGDLVRVRGTVREEQRAPNELPTTVVVVAAPGEAEGTAGPGVEVLARDQPLPAATAAPSAVELADVRRAIAAWEALEGMLLGVPRATVIGPPTRFGEVAVLLGEPGPDAVRTVHGGLLDGDSLRPRGEPFLLDDQLAELGVLADAAVGDRIETPLVGIVDYRFGSYRLQLLETPQHLSRATHVAKTATAAKAGELSVATLNVENLDLGDPPSRFRELGAFVVESLRSPDLLLLQEVQDDSGPQDDGEVSSDATLRRLAGVIVAAGGPSYSFRYIRPRDGEDGGVPGGNIRTVLLLRRDRGLRFVDRPPLVARAGDRDDTADGTALLHAHEQGLELRPSPARVAPRHPAFFESRKPLAVEVRVAEEALWVIGVHFASKSGDDPVAGSYQPPRRRSSVQRTAQARRVAELVRDILGHDPLARVLVLGDFNDGLDSPALAELERVGLKNLMAQVPEPERYTYVYQGRSQVLDHVLASSSLVACCSPEIVVVHANADVPAARRLSDHDPVVVTFRLERDEAQP